MKNYRLLVPIGMIAIMVLSWYMLISEVVEKSNVYEDYLAAARLHAEDGTKYAIENYLNALAEKSSPELYNEIAQYYREKGSRGNYINWCEDFLTEYPTNSLAYECVLEAYLVDEDYKAVFDVLEVAQKRNVSSDKIEQTREELKYYFSIDYKSFDEVGVYGTGLCPVRVNGSWGFLDRVGTVWISCMYKEVGNLSNESVAPVVDSEGNAYFIDSNGGKVKVSKEKYKSFGLLSADRSVAKCEDDTYCYVNSNLERVFGNYEFATTINLGRAAVKSAGVWSIIDENGAEVSADKYVDVKCDEKNICYRNDRIFVAKQEGQYILLDGTANRVGNLTFEDAHVFLGTAPAAVKINGKWCFVNADGTKISDKTYEDARSFSNGLAAVKINGKWGFVDETETVVIEPQFENAKDFNDYGSCFVNISGKWQLIKLYRINR